MPCVLGPGAIKGKGYSPCGVGGEAPLFPGGEKGNSRGIGGSSGGIAQKLFFRQKRNTTTTLKLPDLNRKKTRGVCGAGGGFKSPMSATTDNSVNDPYLNDTPTLRLMNDLSVNFSSGGVVDDVGVSVFYPGKIGKKQVVNATVFLSLWIRKTV